MTKQPGNLQSRLVRLFFAAICLILASAYSARIPSSRAQEPATPRRVNIPHQTGSVNWTQTAIFWFGKNELGLPGKNYTDVRVVYTDWGIELRGTVIDYYLWYKQNPSLSDDLTRYDALAVYLDTNNDGAATPRTDDYMFLLGARNWESSDNYMRQARGTGTDWDATWDGYWIDWGSMDWESNSNGPNDNGGNIDYGWTAGFVIPWSSIGMSAPPPEGTVIGLGIQLFDRDASPPAGYVAPEYWPETFSANTPSTWGELHLGYPVYEPATSTIKGTTVIRDTAPTGQTLADTTVEDARGGGGQCAGGHEGGSEINYGDARDIFSGSETNETHFPCYNKSFLRFSLDDVPTGKEIISATVTLRHFGNAGQNSGLGDTSWISLFTVTDPWEELGVHWNNAPLAQENIAATWVNAIYYVPDWPGIAYDWDVTGAVAEAYAGGDSLSLAMYSSDAGDETRDTTKYFYSSEADVAGRPKLTVSWGDSDPDFSLTPSPLQQAIDVRGVATYTIRIQPSGGFSSTVALAVGVTPPDISAGLVPDTITPPNTEATLTLTDSHSGEKLLPGELYTVVITATSGDLFYTGTVKLLVGGARVYLPLVLK